MSSLFYYYNFLEKQLFNERKALFTQFVEKVSENIDSEIRTLWDDTDSLEKLIHKNNILNNRNMLVESLNEIGYIIGAGNSILMAFNEDGDYYTSDGHKGRICDLLLAKYANNREKHKLFILNLPYKKNSETYFLMVNRLDEKVNIDKNEEITHVAMAVSLDSLQDLFTSEGFEDKCYTFMTDEQCRILYKNTHNNEFLDGYNINSSIKTASDMVNVGTFKDIESSLESNEENAYEIKYKQKNWFVANSSIKAVDTFVNSKKDTYEAIIMDVMMPIMNGIDATKLIRESKHVQANTIPIIAITANAFEEDIKTTKAAGMNAHISKPLNPDILFRELASIRKNIKEV